MIPPFMSMFSGCGGSDQGATQAGLELQTAIEYDANIAGVYRANFGDHIIVSAVEDVDYAALPVPFWLHASTSCKGASVANNNGGEGPGDISAAEAVCRAIVALKPRRFSLENVWQYRHFASFRLILAALQTAGYAVDCWHLNSADYGVPQTRKRLILVASLDHTPRRPPPTHQDPTTIEPGSLFPQHPWIGWYAAVADLLPTFAPATPAPWQQKRIPVGPRTPMLIGGGNTNQTIIDSTYRGPDMPSYAISASSHGNDIAYLVNSENAGQAWGDGYQSLGAPCFAVGQRTRPIAYLLDGQTNELRPANWPAFTQQAKGNPMLANVTGRWMRIGIRGLARFQSFPDTFLWPAAIGLAGTCIGNAVPPLLMQRIIEANV